MESRINLVTNTFGNYHRQNVAVDSWKYLKSLFPFINIIDCQFSDEKNSHTPYDGISTDYCLTRSSLDLAPDATKKLPILYDIITRGFDDNPDYVIYTNSDVILMPKLIREIIGDGLDCAAISRMDIEDIPSFNNILEQNVVPVRMEIAGFDVFVFSREWFLKYEKYFNNDFLIGKPYFDPVIAGLMVAFGGKYKIVNDLPPTAFHIHHGTASVDTSCPERDHNQKIFEDNDLYRVVNNIIYNNLQFNLCRRKPWGRFLAPQESESGSQKIFFDMMNIHIPNQIRYIE